MTTPRGARRLSRVIFSTGIGLGLGLYVSWYIYGTVLQWPAVVMPVLFGGVAYVRESGGHRDRRMGTRLRPCDGDDPPEPPSRS